jgi:hypothetical protein
MTEEINSSETEFTHLIPSTRKKIIHIEDETPHIDFISEFTFSWMSNLVNKASGSNLTEEDMKNLQKEEKAEDNIEILRRYINFYHPKNFLSLLGVVFLCYWKLILWIFLLDIVSTSSVLISPYFIQQLLNWFNSKKMMNSNQIWFLEGYGWATCILIATFVGRTLGISVSWKSWLLFIRVSFFLFLMEN